MPLQIVRNDITKMRVDAIVNAANSTLLGGGGVDGCIHRAAGPELLAECRTLGGCEVGRAKRTKAYCLPCKYVIHTVGPVWSGGNRGERALLHSCYLSSLTLAKESGCQSIAFPLISAGAYGYPREEAFSVAVEAIRLFLSENEMTVYIVVYDHRTYSISAALFADVSAYIDDKYVEMHPSDRSRPLNEDVAATAAAVPPPASPTPKKKSVFGISKPERKKSVFGTPKAVPAQKPAPKDAPAPMECTATVPVSLLDRLNSMDESFSEMLLRLIDEKGMTDAECYKKANIDRKLFSKIRSDRLYKPSKPTVLAFAVALELSLAQTQDLLQKAGFALSSANKFDIIVTYFLERRNYDVYRINETLFAFDQSLLGG